MGTKTRKQVYLYQYKVNSVANQTICSGENPGVLVLQVAVPNNILDMTALWMNIIIQYNASEPTANMVLNEICIASSITIVGFNLVYTFPANATVVTNVQANGSQVLGYSINLQALLPYIYYYPQTATNSSYFDITISFPTLTYSATLNLWKVDMIYTTQGIPSA